MSEHLKDSPEKRLLRAVVEQAFQDAFLRLGDEPLCADFIDIKQYQKCHFAWRKQKLIRDDALGFVLGNRIFTFTDILDMDRSFVRLRISRVIPGVAAYSLSAVPKPQLAV